MFGIGGILLLLWTTVSCDEKTLLKVASTSERTIANGRTADNLIDSSTSSIYHSLEDTLPEWAKLTLEKESYVQEVVVINR